VDTEERKFVIAYDLTKADPDDYQEMYDFLKKIKAKQVQKSVYTFKSNKTASELRDTFKDYCIKDKDRLLVIDVTKASWASYLTLATPKDL
jgi:CRISPR/Cas system-associated endoribonuclease Cas2